MGRVLGEGGFGITYVGRDTVLNLKVAVKEFYMAGYVNRNHDASDTVFATLGTHRDTFTKNKEKFLSEARVLARFYEEPGIVGVRDFCEENGTAYIIMDFLDGVNLKDYLEQKGRLAPADAVALLMPVMRSLERVHADGIIHRDISPDNIMVLPDGRTKLLDFGAARAVSQTDIKSLSVILKPGYAPRSSTAARATRAPGPMSMPWPPPSTGASWARPPTTPWNGCTATACPPPPIRLPPARRPSAGSS